MPHLVFKVRFLFASAIILICGCVSVTEPVSMGDGRYMITLNARGGFSNDGELLSQSITRANTFCASKGQEAEILDTQHSGVQMWTPQNNQVVFRCHESHK